MIRLTKSPRLRNWLDFFYAKSVSMSFSNARVSQFSHLHFSIIFKSLKSDIFSKLIKKSSKSEKIFFRSLEYAVFVSKVIEFWYTTSRRVMFGGIYCVYTRAVFAAFFSGACSRSYATQIFRKNKFEQSWKTVWEAVLWYLRHDFTVYGTAIFYFPDPSH